METVKIFWETAVNPKLYPWHGPDKDKRIERYGMTSCT